VRWAKVGGSKDLELRFDFPHDLEQAIRADLEAKGRCVRVLHAPATRFRRGACISQKGSRLLALSSSRSTPTFQYGFYLPDGTLSTLVTNTVAIRPRGYIAATTPPASAAQFAPSRSLDLLDSLLRDKLLARVTSK